MRIAYEPGLQETAIVTVCTGEKFAERLREAFEQRAWTIHFSIYEAYLSSGRRPALSTLRSASACVAFVDFDTDPESAAETVQYLSAVLSGRVTVVGVAGQLDPAMMLTAMRAGCTEFLEREASDDTILDTLERLEKPDTSAMRTGIANGSILSFFGAKGGVGTTTLAVHLATYLVKLHKKRVLLVDLHPELGHVCVYLGLDGSRVHFQELVRNVGRLDSELLRGFVARHSSGLEVLSSPDLCGGSKSMDSEAVGRALDFLRGEYDYVLLDCARPNSEWTERVIAASTLIYMVATPDVGAVRDLSRHVDLLIPSDGSSDKLQVILNRASSPYAIDVTQIEKAMKLPIAIRIASSYPELVRADNLGEPLSPDAHTELSGQLAKWASSLVGATSPAPVTKRSKSLFAMFR